jgi:hypothetical protein
MSDPLRPLSDWFGQEDSARKTDPSTELIDYRDRVAYAASLIRDHELRLWFEPNWFLATLISRCCPECAVYSIPPEAAILDDLHAPPPWRVARRDSGIL